MTAKDLEKIERHSRLHAGGHFEDQSAEHNRVCPAVSIAYYCNRNVATLTLG